MEKASSVNQHLPPKLPEGYDVIDTYQRDTEQSIVDNLFAYFGKVYYQKHDLPVEVRKIRNQSISLYDRQLFKFLSKKIGKSGILACIFIIIAAILAGLFLSLVGSNVLTVSLKIEEWVLNGMLTTQVWETLVIIMIWIICLFILFGLIAAIKSLIWLNRQSKERARVSKKVSEWNANYAKFTASLSKSGIKNALQIAIPELIFDKMTPAFDSKTLNLHSRIYSYCNIPQDAKKNTFKNLSSGFYKGNPFTISYSSWEWYREAKVISQSTNPKNQKNVKVRRSLKRFEDSICVLTIDTFAEPKLNFVLNNPDGKNINLQNNVFNKVFALAVNDPRLAYKVFTPYVQHTLSRCKTWADPAKAIRQVIKEGSKIYVVFDGEENFFNFERITNKELNQVFSSKDNYVRQLYGQKVYDKGMTKRVHFGSLDETASLMVEFILDEMDILFSALEMGVCYPSDDALTTTAKSDAKNLHEILEEKKLALNPEPQNEIESETVNPDTSLNNSSFANFQGNQPE